MLRLLRELFRDHPTAAVFEQHGQTHLTAASLQGRSGQGGKVYPMAERFVESVVGVLRLVAGFTGKVEVRALSWQDAQNPSTFAALCERHGELPAED